jgi:hypothetical protein
MLVIDHFHNQICRDGNYLDKKVESQRQRYVKEWGIGRKAYRVWKQAAGRSRHGKNKDWATLKYKWKTGARVHC